jgi:SAM-dependent methyltransferase
MMQPTNPAFDAFSSLRRNEEGIWCSALDQYTSYPEENHDHLFEVEDDSYWHAHRARVLTSLVDRYPPAGSILDVGGGNGYMTSKLERAGFSAVLLNPSLKGLENGRRRGLSTLVHGTFESCGFQPGSLSAVGLFDVLEHVKSAHAMLTQIRTALNDKGRLYLTVPAHRWLWSQFDEFAGHQTRYSLGELRDLVTMSGFKVSFASYYFLPLLIPQFLLRALPYRLGLSEDADAETLKSQLGQGLRGRTLSTLLTPESSWLAKGRRVIFGSSCLVVADASGE